MTARSFWKSAWSSLEDLEAGPSGSPRDPLLVTQLANDLTLQRYVFVHRGFSNPEWLTLFLRDGLFHTPPPVERVEGSLRAWAWPALTYLRSVASVEPDVCSDILVNLESSNWWVVSDALSVAIELPADLARPALLSLLREWERSAIQWTPPETLIQAMKKIATTDPEGAGLAEFLSRVLGRFADDRANLYELSELLPQIRAELGTQAISPLADAVEVVLLFQSLTRDWHRYAYGLDDLRIDADGVELLVHEWLSSVSAEAGASGGFAPLRRSTRLLGTGSGLLRQMGLRSLDISLSAEPAEPRSLQLLDRVAGRDDLTANYEELPELLRLLSRHFQVLTTDRQSALIQRIADQATADDRLKRMFARDWLGALRPHLGARERKLLEDLEPEFGPPRETFARPRVEGSWVGPRSPLTLEELQDLPIADLLGYVRHVPVDSSGDRHNSGATLEGFARMLQPLVGSRIDDLQPHLADLARSAQHSVVLFYLCWGLRDAFAQKDARTPEQLLAVQQFISAATEWAQRQGRTDEAGMKDSDGYSVSRALADLIESLAGWLVDTPDTTALLATLDWLLTSDDPFRNEELADGMDPPSRAINSVRGEAVLAALRMLSTTWGDDSRDRSSLSDGIESLLERNVATEESPAVLSSYARYLSAIITYWRSFFDTHQEQLLPTDPRLIERWGAVLGTYVTFCGPHRSTASILREHFELAISRMPDLGGSYLHKQIERLLMHLIALSLPSAADSKSWIDLCHDSLDAATGDAAARAIRNLSFAVEHDGLEIPGEWALGFVARRADSLTGSSAVSFGTSRARSDEASALLKLLFVCGVSPSACIGHIRHLVVLGASLGFDDSVEYLANHDPLHSHSGAVILQLAASQDGVEGYMRHQDDFRILIRAYASAYLDLAWQTVESLGAHGIFTFEDVARELFAQGAGQ